MDTSKIVTVRQAQAAAKRAAELAFDLADRNEAHARESISLSNAIEALGIARDALDEYAGDQHWALRSDIEEAQWQ